MHKQRGFSLMEVLISVGVLSVAILGVMSVYFWGMKATQLGSRMTQAANYARDLMETIRVQNMAFANGATVLPSAPPTGINDPNDTQRDDLDAAPFNQPGTMTIPSGTNFKRNIRVTQLGPSGYQAGGFLIKVRVFWTDRGVEREVALQAYSLTK